MVTTACSSSVRVLPVGNQVIAKAHGAGPYVVHVPKTMDPFVHLSLWIDAGSRDAEVPQLATATAWIAAGTDFKARVFPDGTEFSRTCRIKMVRECVNHLAQVLSTRTIRSHQVDHVIERLQNSRAVAETDEQHKVDALAMEALFRDETKKMLPFGESTNDKHITRDSINAFLRSHYGVNRALLIVTGAVSSKAIERFVQESFKGKPVASNSHAARMEPKFKASTPQLAWTKGAVPQGVIAATFSNVESANVVAQHLRAFDPAAHLEVFPIRGAGIILWRIQPEETSNASLVNSVHQFALAINEWKAGHGQYQPIDLSDDASIASTQIGQQWTAKANEQFTDPRMGVALIANRTDFDPATARTAIEKGFALANTQVSENARGPNGRVTSPNGVHIEVRPRHDATRVGIAIRINGGASEETARTHGYTALLGQLLTSSCQSMGSEVLRWKLRETGAAFSSIVEPDSLTLLMDASSEDWRNALNLAVFCASHPSTDRRDFEEARGRAIRILESSPSALTLGNASTLIRGNMPGKIAPWGSRSSLHRATNSEVLAWHKALVKGARVRVAVIGDVSTWEALESTAQHLALLPKGEPHLPETFTVEEVPNYQVLPLESQNRTTAVMMWHLSNTQTTSRFVGAAFAEAMAKSLERNAQAHPAWHAGQQSNADIWAAIGIETSRDNLELLPDAIRNVDATFHPQVAQSLMHLEQKHALSLARPAVAAQELTRLPSNAPLRLSNRSAIQRLLNSNPIYLVTPP